jgi:transposase-like protein
MEEPMKYRKWDSKTKAQIVLEGLENKVPLAQLCNRYQITQGTFYYWRDQLLAKAPQIFESVKQSKKEQKLQDENYKLKRIIAELSIELKKSELELKDLGQ